MKRHAAPHRRGAATVEFALVVPVFFLLLFGTIEFSRMNMLRHSTASAAFEGARTAIVQGATADDVRTRATAILGAVGVTLAAEDVQVTPATLRNSTPEVTVTVTVPLSDHFWITPRFLGAGIARSSFTLQRDRL